jgi:hypothetical protein
MRPGVRKVSSKPNGTLNTPKHPQTRQILVVNIANFCVLSVMSVSVPLGRDADRKNGTESESESELRTVNYLSNREYESQASTTDLLSRVIRSDFHDLRPLGRVFVRSSGG